LPVIVYFFVGSSDIRIIDIYWCNETTYMILFLNL